MTPSQVSMKPEVESKGEVSKKGMSFRCVSNCQDTTFDMYGMIEPKDREMGVEENMEVDGDGEVDVVGCSNGGNGFRMGGYGEDTDATEYSSSFGDTRSGNEDGFSDNEVDSIYGDGDLFDGMYRVGKRKVVTDHWRRYANPLIWRGKWIELRMKEMKSQLSKYERELALNGQRQHQLDLGHCTSVDNSVKSLPFSGQSHKKEVMKRRKRKKIEDMIDISSYMSHHHLFSYYENVKSDADGALVDEIFYNQAGINADIDFDIDLCQSLGIGFGDCNSFEHVLWKIDTVQSRVQKLKTQVDKLLALSAGKFSSMESLDELAESDVPTSSPGSPDISHANVDNLPSGALCTPPQHISDHHERTFSSYGDAAPHLAIVECPVGLLAEEVRLDQSYLVETCQNNENENDILHHEEVKKEPHEFEKLSSPSMKSLAAVKEEVLNDVPIILAVKPENLQVNTIGENSALRSSLPSEYHGPLTKRKRGERKAGTWTDPFT